MKDNIYKKYCSGCGLCHSIKNTELIRDDRGFIHPKEVNDEDMFKTICPVAGAHTYDMDGQIWGKAVSSYLGWSNDFVIRKSASSGGILTTICCYLIKEKIVDGVIQTKVDDSIPYATQTVISRTADEVKECMGSRYSISTPLSNILQIIKPGEKYAFVGKPCDVSTLRSYMKQNEIVSDQISYLFSFFCAGVPSNSAQKKLLNSLNVEESNCISLQYRGNGWPGFASALDTAGQVHTMTYEDSWGKILGRDVSNLCRFCIDGVGESADISCGDAWYLKSDGTPDFSENEGRNVIIARTNKGEELLKSLENVKKISLEPYDMYQHNGLQNIQKFQFERKATMQSMLLAMKLFHRPYPNYSRQLLTSYSKCIPLKYRVKRFFGTVKRIVKKKI